MGIARLTEAIGLRECVNGHYLSDDVHKLGTRTLRSLIDEIQHEQQQASWPRTSPAKPDRRESNDRSKHRGRLRRVVQPKLRRLGGKRAGAGKAAGRYGTQAEAHDAARGFVERSGGGEVRDHRKDNNRIRNTDTVGKKDPYPPKG
jgi:hypothetical protein